MKRPLNAAAPSAATTTHTLEAFFKECPPHHVQEALFNILHDALVHHEKGIACQNNTDLYVLYQLNKLAFEHAEQRHNALPPPLAIDQAFIDIFNKLGPRKDWPEQYRQTLKEVWEWLTPNYLTPGPSPKERGTCST